MERTVKFLTFLVSALLIATLCSCGGGGGSQVAEGGIGGTGISMGRVTGFGSIFVNGIEYETNNASFTVNNSTGSQSDLAIGMVVQISGSNDQLTGIGEAASVEYNSLLEGVLDRNDMATNNTLTIMSQVISVDLDSVYENPIDSTLLVDLPINSVVEVSGFTDGNGDILATRIEVKSLDWAEDKLEVSGVVNNISGTRFMIGSLIIEAADALPIPTQGTFVKVEGDSFSGSIFEADSIAIEGDGTPLVAEDGKDVEIEGRITTSLDSNNLFALNGQSVDASATLYSGQLSQIVVGRIAKVQGIMSGSTLLAEKICLQVTTSEKGELADILGSGDVDTSAGTITLLGQTIQINNSTIMDSDLRGESTFTLSQLNAGDYLEAKVYFENDILIASKLEREQTPSHHTATAKGIPEWVDTNTIRLFGVPIDTSGVSYTFSDRTVDIVGDYINGVLVATSINTYDEDESDHYDEDEGDHHDEDESDHHDDSDHD
ncbi:MAG: DUF5666 domain-containing protein [Candidatus Thiodiazotropha sp.]